MRLRYRFPDLHISLSTESRDKEVVPTAPNDGTTIIIASASGTNCPQTIDAPQPSPKPVITFHYATPNKPSAKTPSPSPQLPKVTGPHPAAAMPPARKNGVVASNGVHPSLRHILPAPAKTQVTTNGVGAFAPKTLEKNRISGTVPGSMLALSAQPESRQDESPAAKRPHVDSRKCNEAMAS